MTLILLLTWSVGTLLRRAYPSTGLLKRDGSTSEWKGTNPGVDLIAMVVSDSGLAADEPKWWNCSPIGCLLIGLQPRGGWQIMQRAVQWGDDHWAHAFGVNCSGPLLYSYFACTIRNRIEVWDSNQFHSPMEGVPKGGQWLHQGDFKLKRPTKLIDGSRGGQAFLCELLCPAAGNSFTIEEQAHAQFLSVILVGAGLMSPEKWDGVEKVVEDDFGLSARLGPIFRRMELFLIIGSILSLGFATSTLYSLFKRNIYGEFLPFAGQLSSTFVWAVGATGLLMLGGNPRVKISTRVIPQRVRDRIDAFKEKQAVPMTLQFGSLHGSVFTQDRGSCTLPKNVVETICSWELRTKRTAHWIAGCLWFSGMLLTSMGILISMSRMRSVWSDIMGIGILLATSIARGSGVSGSEEWMIPRWKRRKNTAAGANLLGAMQSRI